MRWRPGPPYRVWRTAWGRRAVRWGRSHLPGVRRFPPGGGRPAGRAPAQAAGGARQFADLRNKLAGNEKLEDLLGEVLASTENAQGRGRHLAGRERAMSTARRRSRPPNQAVLGGLLDRIVEESRVAQSEQEKSRARDIIGELVSQVLEGEVVVSDNLAASIDARVAELDRLISEQLQRDHARPEFQALRAPGRACITSAARPRPAPTSRSSCSMPASARLVKDFKSAIDFDQSALFKKSLRRRVRHLRRCAFRCPHRPVRDHPPARGHVFIDQMSHVAAAAHAPFITAAAPQLFGLESFLELGKPRDMGKVFDTVEYAKWKSFRESEDARYVGLALPRFLGRLPYNPSTACRPKVSTLSRRSTARTTTNTSGATPPLRWQRRLTDAFDNYGWCAAIRGVEGGLVEDLPTHTFRTDDGEIALKCPTEVSITDRREKELSDLGFIPLVHCKNTDYAAFFGAQSAQRPRKYDSDAANANAACRPSSSTCLPCRGSPTT